MVCSLQRKEDGADRNLSGRHHDRARLRVHLRVLVQEELAHAARAGGRRGALPPCPGELQVWGCTVT